MADWTVVSVNKGWNGDIRRNRVVVTGTNADDLSPALVGLHRIDAVVPTGRSGTISGVTCVAGGAAAYDGTNLSVWTAADSPAALSNSSAELLIYGV